MTKQLQDLQTGDKVIALVDFFTEFSYGKVQRLTKGKVYELLRPAANDYDLSLNIICDAGHCCWWDDGFEPLTALFAPYGEE